MEKKDCTIAEGFIAFKGLSDEYRSFFNEVKRLALTPKPEIK